ncbi:MAG TPA: SDR family oxidoreductase [Alphaproteobacteria bacterium]|nr:SDR family oxidoreductase [Alphaproteobacteria bacterium]
MTGRRLFVFGLGYTARHLAQSWLAEGWRVAGTFRNESAAALGDLEIETYRFDRDHPLSDFGAALAGTTHLLSSVPPDGDGDLVLDCHGRDIAALEGLEWAGYLSTTGVYGDREGGEVDESSALSPTSERGRRRAAAEAGWLALHEAHLLPVHIFRLAGIYGPGRSALDAVRAGTARRIAKPGHIFSRIHVDDIVATLRASAARPNPGAVYNLCDDHPAAGEAVIAYACKLLKIEPPALIPIGEAGLSPMAASFYRDSKRVSNARIKRELGVRLQFPDYRAGLEAILEGEA